MWGQFWSQKSRKPTQVLKMDYVALDVEELLSLSLYVGMRRGTSFDLISANAFILPILCIFPTPIQLTPVPDDSKRVQLSYSSFFVNMPPKVCVCHLLFVSLAFANLFPFFFFTKNLKF